MTRPSSPRDHGSARARAAALDALFSQICRATADEARELALLLDEPERASIALFCNARAHLREQGRAIASVCSLEHLQREGGQAGVVLFQQIGAGAETWGTAPRETKRRISLAG